MREPRLGHIHFINCLPLTYAFATGGYGQGLTIVRDVPARLNSMVTAGELDVSPVSSIVYAQQPDKLRILPDVSISAEGALQSILLVAKRPISALDGQAVALTAKSATSHRMLKIILAKAYHIAPRYFISPLTLAEGVLQQAEAVLFIGDDALEAFHHRHPDYWYYDLGDEWRKLTGQGMVYALWVVNADFAAKRPAALQQIYRTVTGGFAYGLAHLRLAARMMAGRTPFTAEQIYEYINLLNYGFTERHRQALLTYYGLAYDLGLIARIPELRFAEVIL